MNDSVEAMWQAYLETLSESDRPKKSYTSWPFGADREMAKELAALVLKGEKTATSSLHLLYDVENEPLPKVGDFNIITDWDGNAKAVTKTIDVEVLPFRDISAAFAAKEGEGDKSLAYWRNLHIAFFNNELKEMDKKFTEDMLVVCEVFTIVYS